MPEKYYIGIDLGTDSCGWAVTDEEYNIKKFKGNAMWGIRLFDESQTAEKRRMFRTSRRRLDRRGDRLTWLEMIFADEINKKDPGFFIRLKESQLHLEDKTGDSKYSLFAGHYTDKDFHAAYPTIYRLRRELIESSESHDIRLVFLALHHIIKYRGHFLFEELGVSETLDFHSIFEAFTQYCCGNFEKLDFTPSNVADFEKILRNRNLGKTAKKNEFAKLYGVTKKTSAQLFSCLGLLSGTTEKLSDIFDEEKLKKSEKNSICFADNYEENKETYASILGERFEFIEILKAIYDYGVLADILQGEKYLSIAMDHKYSQHSKDLDKLKKYVKLYCSTEIYSEIFKYSKTKPDKLPNYVAYSGHIKKNGKTGVLRATATQNEFCAYLKKTLGECRDEKYADIFAKIEAGTLCPKQRVGSNGVIPMQVHRKELVKILENAKNYLPFLTVADENGITPEQKIIAIFDYKIPYYVGPLNSHSGKKWLVRSDEKITPWNIHNVIDYDASAEEFINKLTNKCTYLSQHDVIAKNTILYSKYMVLNEINSLKIDGETIPVCLKQELFNRILKEKKITKKFVCNFLKAKNIEFTTITGVDDDIKSNMKSYCDFARFENLSNEEKDDIIKAITVFGNEKKRLKKRIREKYGKRLDDDAIGYIAKLNYSGWGRFSKEFLTETYSIDKSTGELVNIMDALWDTNLNLMQLIYSERYDFEKAIAEAQEGKENTSLRFAVENLYVSPKIKRPIYQALQIVKEIVKTQGGKAPEKIFLEVARFEGKKERTKSRKNLLQELYVSVKNDYADVWKELCDIEEEKLNKDKLFLYFSQCGRCIYTGERININELMSNNSRWDIDHIYPRSKIKDDSLHNNRVLSSKDYNQNVKGPRYPLPVGTRETMQSYWKYLLDKGLIIPEKYNRLICRNPLTDEQLSAFINRQLVETQQSTKAIAGILKDMYASAGTEIVYVKAGLVSDFRNENKFVKSRDINDLHHAKDAYLNIVVGNVYNVQCTHNKANFIKGLQSDENNSYSMNGMFRFNITGAWDRNNSLSIVKKHMAKNNILYTRYSFKNKGELFKQNPLKKGEGQVPLKKNTPLSKMNLYGAYNAASSYCFCLVKHGKSGKEKIGLFAVTLYEKEFYMNTPEEYLKKQYKLLNPVVLIQEIKIQSCFSFDGFRVHLGGKGGGGIVYRPGVQLILDEEQERYVKAIFKFFDKNKSNKKAKALESDRLSCEQNRMLYSAIISKLQNSVFKVIYKDLGDALKEKQQFFEDSALETQCAVLKELMNILHCNATLGDLKNIEIATVGKIKKGYNISEYGYKSLKLINQSVTGLYESEIDLLNM